MAGDGRVRIRQVNLHDFRGVRGALSVSFENRNGHPVSVLISGDNGTGKSSIADAIEWACQGSNRRGTPGSRPPGLINMNVGSRQARAEVELSDGRRVSRTITHEEDKYVARVEGSSGDFARAPMILKRYDILRLLETKPAERGVLFLHLRLTSSSQSANEAPQVTELESEESPLLAIKEQIRTAASRLAELIGFELPDATSQSIDRLLQEGVYRGISKDARRRLKVSVPEAQLQLVREIETLRSELADAQRAKRESKKVAPSKAVVQVQRLAELLEGIDEWLTASFLQITRAPHIRELHVRFAQTGAVSIDFSIDLVNGRTVDPTALFSEGYQDLLSLLFFLATLRAAAQLGQAKVLILDDVLQSVDASIRVSVMDLVVREFKDWQLFLTVHDRLWRAQVVEILRRYGHQFVEVDLAAWDFSSGSRFATAPGDPTASLRAVLPTQDVGAVNALAGRLLEQIADRMSWVLRISIQRSRGISTHWLISGPASPSI